MRRALRLLLPLSALALTHCIPADPVAPIPPKFEAPPPVKSSAPPAPALPPEPAPLGRLPSDVRPVHETVVLQIDPAQPRFFGTVEITVELTRPRDVIWLHGQELNVRGATVRMEGSAPLPATYGEVDPSGVAGLRLAQPVGPGRATLHIDYDAAFGRTGSGLYAVERGGARYAFTQFEAIEARRALPCFDEPAFKIPFDVTLFVPSGQEGIANTRELERTAAPGDMTRITYATTAPLPSYLLAFAVGPLDVVAAPPVPPNAARSRPLPLRGVTTRGRGQEIAYALAHTGEMVAGLESYFGMEYPFDKLDLIAVPDKRGAMENAGAVTFSERLVLLDEATAPTRQRRAFWSVTLHELAHQWFGDLVTMPWWDDLWLNEAFATWSEARILNAIQPGNGDDLRQLGSVHDAMRTDSLISARQVRQDVRSVHDIANAFDDITYRKGAGVIGMFERWMGEGAFRAGISSYLNAHRGGGATADDLFAALTVASGRDVGAPFRTFVNQPGVPLVEAQLSCSPAGNLLALKQKRHLPLGSAGDPSRAWQIPVCAKVPDGKGTAEACTLLTGAEGTLPLPVSKCPAWVMPNAAAAGYYIFSMPPADMKKLTTAAYKDLSVKERIAVVHSLRTSFNRGTPIADTLPLLTPLAAQPERQIVQAAMEPFRAARSWLTQPNELAAIQKEAQRVMGPVWKGLGWAPAKGKTEDDERRTLRADVLSFMVFIARDPAIRKEAADQGRAYVGYGKDGALHPEAADRDLAGICLTVAAEDGDAAFFNHLSRLLDSARDEVHKGRIIEALGAFKAPELAARALAMTFDPRIPGPDLTTILDAQLASIEARDAAWQWFKSHVDDLAAKRSPERRGTLPLYGARFCDRAHADELSALFSERVQKLKGGPRNLAAALEAINLCVATRAVQEPSFRKAFKLPEPKVLAVLMMSSADAPLKTQDIVADPDGHVVDPWNKPKAGGNGNAGGKSNAGGNGNTGGNGNAGGGVVDPWNKPKAGGKQGTGKAGGPGQGGGGLVDPWQSPKKK